MENKALGLDANIGLGFYFPYSTGGNDLTLTYMVVQNNQPAINSCWTTYFCVYKISDCQKFILNKIFRD